MFVWDDNVDAAAREAASTPYDASRPHRRWSL
jgi:hypothetical protein